MLGSISDATDTNIMCDIITACFGRRLVYLATDFHRVELARSSTRPSTGAPTMSNFYHLPIIGLT